MSTAGALVDRVFRDWLNPSYDQPVRATLGAALSDSASNVTLSTNMLTPEERGLIGSGILIEAGQELMMVTAATDSITTMALTVLRAQNGTTAAAHSSGAIVQVAPTFARRTVFDAVCDAIEGLFPDLWHTVTVSVNGGETLEVPATVTGGISYQYRDGSDWLHGSVKVRTNYPGSPTGVAVRAAPDGTTGYALLRSTFERPASESVEVDDVEENWYSLVVLGAVAAVLGSVDMSALRTEYITERFERELVPPSTGMRLAESAIRQYEYQMNKARGELFTRYPVPIVIGGSTYGGW